ncbi:MAG TPA: sugar ABC transporter substrate-binding protein [Aquabacterium sp.]|uniref:ABC transporter substrate-binding protein n=1 Tax=Aquabacterium sp. TaxID=1872578 RepID=UPI002E344A91|nr:sugar ABC transporter substrate-binding protein [Aquabacterium sp.]HEX5355961.1 sugar ABC transporter substrate-binding protein [Aquabacterium sp.]
MMASATELVIATVNNGHMITLQKLSGEFERTHPDIQLKWITLEEGQLRQQVTRDVTTKAGQFDVMTIGAYEAPIWAKKGWIRPLTPSPRYDVADLLPPIRQSLSVEGQLYALPFYGESSMTMVRTDLLKAAGIKLGPTPTWAQIRDAADKLHAPDKGVYGICLRGKPGWGENMSLITTMVNTFGGQWFNMNWQPQLQTPAWRNALTLYADLLNQFGPPGAAANGYNENLALFMDGRCAIWVDATVAGSFVNRAGSSKVAGKVAFLQAPVAVTPKGAHWVWTWALAIPTSSGKAQAAQSFMEWATSRDYIRLVAEREGWDAVPSGTRQSTYASPQFRRANPHALVEQQAISTANPQDATLPRSPYTGIQWASIPEFQAIGTAVGQEISDLLQDPVSVDEVLSKSQQIADRKMRAAGYYR